MGSVKSIADAAGEATEIAIECHITQGLPSLIIVGFANRAVDEAKERIRAAFHASNVELPKKRITINLAPADIPKDSTAFDLGIAAAIMQAAKTIKPISKQSLFVGELGLEGDVRAVRGIIGKVVSAKSKGFSTFYVPQDNVAQALLVPGVELVPVRHLKELYLHLSGAMSLSKISSGDGVAETAHNSTSTIDFQDISGQVRAKRVMEIAAAGGHNALLSGPPGTGKSMLAKALPSILPAMSLEEILEVTHLHSLASHNFERIITERPMRSPHHSSSEISIIGGGQHAKPGEISLAHRGVLFLDEFPEYTRTTIEALRQPLEDKLITIARAKQSAQYPADFILIATSNPCPCGYFGSTKICNCLPHQILQYQRKLSGPIVDRIDLYTQVDNVEHKVLLQSASAEPSAAIRKRVEKARRVQATRFGAATKTNAQLTNRDIKTFAKLEEAAETLLNQAAERLQISARAYMRLIKVARTIADLSDSETIAVPHISEAIQYRKTENS